MVYSGHASLVDRFTTDRSRTVHAIEKAAAMTSDEPAHFNQVVYQAATALQRSGSPANRRVIIWLTDNLPNVPFRKEYPAHTECEAFRALHEAGVVVAPILLKSPLWQPEERLPQLIDELRARYTIAYRPSDPQPAGTFRQIRVELLPSCTLRPKEWTALAQQGYYRK